VKESDLKLLVWIINKMIRSGYWGRKHIGFVDFVKSGKASGNNIMKAVKLLMNKGWLLNPHVKRYSLNPRVYNEIIEFLDKNKHLLKV